MPVCESCGEPLTAGSRRDSRYCSHRCRQRAYRRRRTLRPASALTVDEAIARLERGWPELWAERERVVSPFD